MTPTLLPEVEELGGTPLQPLPMGSWQGIGADYEL